MSQILEVGQTEFDRKTAEEKGLVLVDFSATWCGPCRRMLPELEAAAKELAGQATVLKVDVDSSPELAARFGVSGIPNLTFLRGGQVVDVSVGLMSKAQILSRAKKNLETVER